MRPATARTELLRRLLLDVLGLPSALCEDGGPMALPRRKLAAEPQIHGGKAHPRARRAR